MSQLPSKRHAPSALVAMALLGGLASFPLTASAQKAGIVTSVRSTETAWWQFVKTKITETGLYPDGVEQVEAAFSAPALSTLAKYKLNDHVEAYSRFIYSGSTSAPQLASSGTFGFSFEVPLTNPFLSTQAATYLAANNPVATCSVAAAGQCVDVGIRWRAVPVGPRQYNFQYDTIHGLVGFRGDFMGWDWDVAASHGETSLQRQQNNDIDADKFQQALFASSTTACIDPSGLCSPINIFNPAVPVTSAAAQFVSLNLQVQSLTTQDYVTAVASRDLGSFKSPWATSPIPRRCTCRCSAMRTRRCPDCSMPGPKATSPWCA